MEGLAFLIVLLVLFIAVSGPIALILVTRLSKKVDLLIAGKTPADTHHRDVVSMETIQAVLKEESSQPPEEDQPEEAPLEDVPPPDDQRIEQILTAIKSDLPFIDNSAHADNVTETAASEAKPDKARDNLLLEQRIGTHFCGKGVSLTHY